MIPCAEIGGIVGDGVFPVSHDGSQRGREIICDRIRVGRRVVVLTEDRVRRLKMLPVMFTQVGVGLLAEGIELAMK